MTLFRSEVEIDEGTGITVGDNPSVLIPDLPDNEPELLAYANGLLRSLGESEAECGANIAALKIETESLRARYADLDAPLARRVEGLEAELRRIYEALPHRGVAKSRKLAYGVIGTRRSPERLEVTDEAVLREELDGWDPARAAVVLHEVKPRIDLRALAAAIRQAGAVPAGVVIHPAGERFYATPDVRGLP